jgi:CheY-like chemotaxis protein
MNSPGREIRSASVVAVQTHRILTVDDDDIILCLLTEILTGAGYEITTAVDGREALELIEHEQFDLIISDIVMPDMNGFDVLKAALENDPEYPVIMFTGYPSEQARDKAFAMGATDYIIKPADKDIIKDAVTKALMKRAS